MTIESTFSNLWYKLKEKKVYSYLKQQNVSDSMFPSNSTKINVA